MVSASIVLYNTSLKDISRLLKCVAGSGIDRLFIIDNSPRNLFRLLNLPVPENAEYIFNGRNLGYGSGHNIGIRAALEQGTDYHIVLNPDIYWQGDIVTPLVKYMDSHPDVGQAMPEIRYPDGRTQLLCKLLPRPLDLIGRRFIPVASIQRMIDRRYELHSFGYDCEMEIPSLSGCFMFLRGDALRKVGIFDERYFMYAEDMDLCRRIGSCFRTMFVPAGCVYHEYEKGSYHNSRLLRMHITSIIRYFNKWGWWSDSFRKTKNRECLSRLREK